MNRFNRRRLAPLSIPVADGFCSGIENMNGEPVMPIDEEFDEADNP
jgi:hypothetical protein